MKKLILLIGVTGTLIVYSLGIRHESPVIGKPASLAVNSPASNTQSSAGSSPPSNTSTSTSNNSTTSSNGSTSQYKDGTYTGSVADAYYGNVQVSATISGGKISDVTFLQYPDTHSTSVEINQQAMPYLKQEAIQAQSGQVQVVSGATFTSQAFVQSLSSALSRAKA